MGKQKLGKKSDQSRTSRSRRGGSGEWMGRWAEQSQGETRLELIVQPGNRENEGPMQMLIRGGCTTGRIRKTSQCAVRKKLLDGDINRRASSSSRRNHTSLAADQDPRKESTRWVRMLRSDCKLTTNSRESLCLGLCSPEPKRRDEQSCVQVAVADIRVG